MKTMMTAAVIAAGLGSTAIADGHANDVTLQLQWVTQAQFAGYYVALDKGFYDEEGLNVTILPGGPDIAPPQVLAGGGADIMLNWMPSALAAREKGLPVVNIAQPFTSSGLMLTCWKDTGIETVEDFRGKTIGVWFFGNEYPFLSWMSQVGISTEGGDDGVTVIDAGVDPEELVTFKYEDQGVATLEDGIYALEDNLDDPVFVDKMVRFVRASMAGWRYAEENVDEAAAIIMEYDETGAQSEAAQARMMGEIAKLTAGGSGALDVAAYERTVATLLAGGSDPVISMEPTGAWTSAITDEALN
ncbi:Formylaminopyrimidine-binding protein [Nymphon striatum]|nr:Formylaminopyrimidine-binding protein [Nymphon striatum]